MPVTPRVRYSRTPPGDLLRSADRDKEQGFLNGLSHRGELSGVSKRAVEISVNIEAITEQLADNGVITSAVDGVVTRVATGKMATALWSRRRSARA